MVTQAESCHKRNMPNIESQTTSLEGLMRLLVHRIAKIDQRSAQPIQNIEEVMLDVDVDGLRYLLVRLPKPDQAQVALSPREHEIARMVAKGHHNKTIAGVLNISSWTVCTHLRRIFAKLCVNSRAAMVSRLADIDIIRETPSLGPNAARYHNEPSGFGSPVPLRSVREPNAKPRPQRLASQARELTKTRA